jgi:cysteinyl-tRNA synthetase
MSGNNYRTIKLYNSLTKQVEEVKPIEGDTFRIYSCGPTVYNNLHIGNLATQIREDLLRRVLEAAGYKVKHAMNITDVEDKIIRDSRQPEFWVDGDPMQSLLNLTKKYDQIFREDIAKIGNDVDSIQFIKATDTIAEMLSLINKLLKSGIAYKADDGIYFSIEKYLESGHEYGLLQNIDLGSSRERIKNDEYEKDSAADFALWKAQSEDEPAWDGEFIDESGLKFSMPGRPGWHIECSAMSQKLLGVPFDIHTGGIDLKFPHHENEIAQSCGALKLDGFAKNFVHMNHIMVDGRKMSKSLNNFYTLRDIEEKGFSPQAFRLLVLSGHYQNETNFSWEILEAAQNRLNNWQALVDMRWQNLEYLGNQDVSAPVFEEELVEILTDNLDTPRALAYIDKTIERVSCEPCIEVVVGVIENTLGIGLIMEDISDQQKELLDLRQEARDSKDFAESDRIRDLLLEQGIKLKDTDRGQIWNRA